ncbi:MAG: SDR family oxidoreductase [Proteobacteria bacterium]|nr:SDR family oxidoreductase [Pseudomonadota bacterium]MBI3499127.1 SDR family oxidoreductase [Pseudomonadota bacterium]
MVGRMAGKIAVITAAGQGMGKAAAEAFQREGAIVHATDVDAGKLSRLAKLPNVHVRRLDVLDPAQVRAAAKEIGAVDVLYNCAGYVHSGTILDCEEKDFEFSVDLNLRSMYRMIRAFLPAMVERRRGSIINMASVASSIRGLPNRFIYGTTKAAVIGLTKSVAADTVSKGIRCNAICPGTIDTPSLEERINTAADPQAARQAFIARQPMGRLGNAEEMAHIAVYLGSDESAYATGQLFIIDGGLTM